MIELSGVTIQLVFECAGIMNQNTQLQNTVNNSIFKKKVFSVYFNQFNCIKVSQLQKDVANLNAKIETIDSEIKTRLNQFEKKLQHHLENPTWYEKQLIMSDFKSTDENSTNTNTDQN